MLPPSAFFFFDFFFFSPPPFSSKARDGTLSQQDAGIHSHKLPASCAILRWPCKRGAWDHDCCIMMPGVDIQKGVALKILKHLPVLLDGIHRSFPARCFTL